MGAIASVSWADHLTFGEGDARLLTPDAVARRMDGWRDDFGATELHWRVLRARIPGTFYAAPGYRHPSEEAAARITWDDLAVVPRLARDAGLNAWLYASLFDEGWPLPSAEARARSYHNAMHGQHVAWQSRITEEHPEWLMMDRDRGRHLGVVCLAYADARQAFVDRWLALLEGTRFRGLFLCLRSQSRPPRHADQFGFNAPVEADYRGRFGHEISSSAFDVHAWRDLLGEYLTTLLRELHRALAERRLELSVGVPRGDVLGPPLGNTTLDWRRWLREGLIDAIVIDQNSSQCPSMWHRLWPMHRGDGYLQDHSTGANLPALASHVEADYAPEALRAGRELFVARQWCERDASVEARLRAIPGVSGLVFSSFRHDNPEAVGRGDWRAGALDTPH